MALKIVPTKGNLIQTKKSLALANMGYDLMDKKRNVLIKEMMTQLDAVKTIRVQITDAYQKAYDMLQEANMSMGLISEFVETIPVDHGIEIAYRSVMGVEIPKINYTKQPIEYDFESSNSKVDYAYACFSEVKQLTTLLAEVENSVYRLANAIRKTQKRANALKNISIPQFEKTVKYISESLEEKEREEFSRQKVIKNMKQRES